MPAEFAAVPPGGSGSDCVEPEHAEIAVAKTAIENN